MAGRPSRGQGHSRISLEGTPVGALTENWPGLTAPMVHTFKPNQSALMAKMRTASAPQSFPFSISGTYSRSEQTRGEELEPGPLRDELEKELEVRPPRVAEMPPPQHRATCQVGRSLPPQPPPQPPIFACRMQECRVQSWVAGKDELPWVGKSDSVGSNL